ncbi:hypothetical protein DRH14_02750 [Candidatus Shapirobacteria bacterium]|nr:MAG: hypothetical protein DRH14_02750 [Candidatus Shapirobacteria bacterium]
MKKERVGWIIVVLLVIVVVWGVVGWVGEERQEDEIVSPLVRRGEQGKKEKVEKKKENSQLNCGLAEYDFENLRKKYKAGGFEEVEWQVLDRIKEVDLRRDNLGYKTADFGFKSRRFRYKSGGKWISGMMNYFEDDKKRPMVIMIRGYADREGYYSGFGSWKMADELAKKGWLTMSMDFLGFGQSDEESVDIMEARFEKVPVVLDLMEMVKKLDFVDKDKIAIWAHSNGGQIAISVLEISEEKYPTVLWAPMTNPFPKSLWDTADEMDDGGKLVIERLEKLDKNCDVKKYSIDNYYDWLEAPVLVQQGSWDKWCKVEWQEEMVDKLGKLGKEAELVVYEKDNHNLSRNWHKAVKKAIEFYQNKFGS